MILPPTSRLVFSATGIYAQLVCHNFYDMHQKYGGVETAFRSPSKLNQNVGKIDPRDERFKCVNNDLG